MAAVNGAENLLTQTEARTEARRLNAAGDHPDGTVNVADTVPAGCWAGRERGWTVRLVPTAGLT